MKTKHSHKKFIFYPCFVSCPFSVSYINHPKAQILGKYLKYTAKTVDILSRIRTPVLQHIYTIAQHENINILYIVSLHLPYLCRNETKHSLGYVHFRLRIWGNEGVYVLCLIRSLWDFTLTFVSMTLKFLSQSSTLT